MDKNLKNIFRYIFWTAVAVVLVWFCVKAVNWNEFLGALKMCKWGYVAAAFAVGCIFIVVRGLRWHMLIKPIDPAIGKVDVINAYGIGFLANLVLPRAGEVVKVGYVVKHSRHSWDAVIGSYLLEKGIDAVILLCLTAVFLAGSWGKLSDVLQLGAGPMIWLAAGLAAAALGFLTLCFALREKGGIWAKCWNAVKGVGKGLGAIRELEKPGLFILYTASIWASFWLTSALIIWALQDIEPFTVLTTADALNLTVTGSITTLVPVPGGFGAYHGAVATVMQVLYDIPLGSGMVYATLNHESQVLAQAVVGLWCYVRETFLRKQ